MKVLFSIIFSIAGMFLISSCSQPAGPTGPTGNKGPTGSGGFEVYYETVSPTAWKTSDSANGNLYQDYYNYTFTGFTIQSDASLELPIVEVYYSTASGSNAIYYPLPASNIWDPNDLLTYSFSSKLVNLIYQNPNNGPLSIVYIKIVIIPVP